MDTRFPARSDAFTTYRRAVNVIGGVLAEPRELDGTLPVDNPRYGRAMSEVLLSGPADVEAAVCAGERALPEWRERPLRERAQVLYALRERLRENLPELAWLISHENGKVYAEAKAEVDKAIECCEYGCALANVATGQTLEVSRGVRCETRHEPLGVVAGVAPFNFPLMVPMWMVPQALAAGNSFILKPSERVPLSALRLAELLAEAGLPAGVFNVVQGGRRAVEALADHPRVRALAFVGSTAAARSVYARATAARKRALCLGGAKNHLIVLPDANVEMTAENVVASFTGGSGQRCMAASVLVTVGDCRRHVEAICARAAALAPGVDLGPLTSAESVARIRRLVDASLAQGAKLLLDGRGANPVEGGYWLGPTILDAVRPEMPAGCEELFGPVLSVVHAATVEEAVALENASPYGNAACVYTESGELARRVVERLEAGMCGVNVGVPVPREPFGFGGWNASAFGVGNITGYDGYRFWTRERKVSTKWSQPKDRDWMS